MPPGSWMFVVFSFGLGAVLILHAAVQNQQRRRIGKILEAKVRDRGRSFTPRVHFLVGVFAPVFFRLRR
jgi:hypothetical protein